MWLKCCSEHQTLFTRVEGLGTRLDPHPWDEITDLQMTRVPVYVWVAECCIFVYTPGFCTSPAGLFNRSSQTEQIWLLSKYGFWAIWLLRDLNKSGFARLRARRLSSHFRNVAGRASALIYIITGCTVVHVHSTRQTQTSLTCLTGIASIIWPQDPSAPVTILTEVWDWIWLQYRLLSRWLTFDFASG